MAALVFLPQRFLYSMAVAGASVGVLSAVIALLVVPSLLALLGTRIDALSIRRGAGGLRRLRRLVPARARGDAPPGRRRAGQLRPAARRRGAAALDDADRPERRGRAARPARLRGQRATSRRTTPRDVTEAVTVDRRRAGEPRAARRLQPADRGDRRHRRAAAPFVRAADRVAYANFALAGPALRAIAGRRRRDPRPRARRRRPPRWSPATPPASSTRSRASLDHLPLADRDHLRDHAGPPLPAHRLGDPAAEDAADERDDARRRVRDPRPRLPGGSARRPLRLHRARPRSR